MNPGLSETENPTQTTPELVKTAYPGNELANSIVWAVSLANFGENRRVVPVTDAETIASIHERVGFMDFRVKRDPNNRFGSVFEGLSFDSEKIRSQAFAIYEGDTPIAQMTLIIEPTRSIKENRYFKKEVDGVRIVDAHAITGDELPNFYIVPGWTKVSEDHLGRLAVPGFRALQRAIEILKENAPENTWIEVVAEGVLPSCLRMDADKLSEKTIGTFVPFMDKDMPFNPDIMELNSVGSSSTVKMAELIGLKRLDGLSSDGSLGPVFAARVK